MRDQTVPYFVGLDIGTSMVRCVVGTVDATDGSPTIIGHGSSFNQGMRKGVVVHIDEVAQAVIQAITEAERVSGMRINTATVNINGSHITGTNSKGVIAISAANREISVDDRYRVEEAAAIMQLPANREIIQVFAKNYRLDGQDNIKDPVGMHGVRLEVDTHIVTAATPSIKSLDSTLEKAGVQALHHTVSALASAEAVLNRQQKESGTLLLDIGAGTTNIVVVEDGEVQHVAVLPIGGINITNDLAIGLKTDLDIAEQVKVMHASLNKTGRKSVAAVTHGHKQFTFDADTVYMIVEARVEELFEYVDRELKKIGRSRKLPGGVVLTGGTAKLPGIAEFAKEQLQLAARVGTLQPIGGLADIVEDSAFFSAIGLMLLDMLLVNQHDGAPQEVDKNIVNFATGLFKRFKH